jgi:pimeloyl-ACP methyl ester carboxylesterase
MQLTSHAPALYWSWRGHPIRYQQTGNQGPALLLIHGFGASSDHWRKTLNALNGTYQLFAIDLLGFGLSDKPAPSANVTYCFETWGTLITDFCEQVIGTPAFLVANSIGCIVALQTAVTTPNWVRGLVLMNFSLRLLHERKRQSLPWIQQVATPLFQALLAYPPVGRFFFRQIATPKAIANFLNQAYARKEAVTDELVQLILAPAQTPGAADVFLNFIQYTQGPLAEDLLPQCQCPCLILWGEEDPWEPIALGRQAAQDAGMTDFISLPGVGHCPQDEAPELVHPLVCDWIQQIVDG